jgi:DNA modification methylase
MSSVPKLSIAYKSPTDLIPYANNARTHSKRQIRQIAESIRAFGFNNPVLIDSKNTIIAGHGRVEAAKLLKLEVVPTVCLDELSEDQVRAYILADNKLALLAQWDESILAIELQHLSLSCEIPDLSITGFEVPEIDLILQEAERVDVDDTMEPFDPGPAITQPGDLWQLGKHRVLCGSALEETSFSVLMGGRRAHMAFVDPPFNVKIYGNVSGKGIVKHADFAMASGEMDEAEFTTFLTDSLNLLARHTVSGSVHYVCMDFRHQREMLAAGDQAYDTLLNLCVWVKNMGGQGSFYRSRHEMVYVYRNGKVSNRNNIQLGKYGRYRTNVWEYPAIRGLSQQQSDEGNLLALHPTVKPVALVSDAILDVSARGDLVLDSFLGSGSTLVSSERTGRICYGMELDPKYVDTAIRRWQRHTGNFAIHSVSGKRFDDIASKEKRHG